MTSYELESTATAVNFDEEGYLAVNPDVAEAVRQGRLPSGRYHFDRYGFREHRRMRRARTPEFLAAKARKLDRIAPLLRRDLPCVRTDRSYDFLSDALRQQHGIDDGGAESSNNYDPDALAMFERHVDGVVLDVGAGRRAVYFEHVVNIEIAAFDSTDVRSVAEELPFNDNSVDAVICIAVLEHVRDPFRAAREIVRVLKPGGDLICCVPFLQPLHGYPHHYYNMTHEGLRHLFDGAMRVDRITTPDSTLPIWSISWILRSWSEGLSGRAKRQFLDLRVSELIGEPNSYLDAQWVRELSAEKNLELASACVLFASKR